MESLNNFWDVWKEIFLKKKSDELAGMCQVILDQRIDDVPADFLKNLGNAIGDYYTYSLKSSLSLSQVYEDLKPIFKVFHNNFKQNLSSIQSSFLDKTKDFLKSLLNLKQIDESSRSTQRDLLILLIQLLDLIMDYKSFTDPKESLQIFILSVYQTLLSKSFPDQNLQSLFTFPFKPEDKFHIKVAGITHESQDLTLLILLNLKKTMETIKHINEPNLSSFLSCLSETLLNCEDFQSGKISLAGDLALQKIQIFFIIQKLMFSKNQKKDQLKIFYKIAMSKCQDLVYLALVYASLKCELDELTSFKKDLSQIGITFSVICNFFSDAYYEEVEQVLISVFEKFVAEKPELVTNKFINYTLQLIKSYFKHLGLRCTRSLWLNSEDSGLIQFLFSKSVFVQKPTGSFFVNSKLAENWNKIWLVICKNSRNFKWLSLGIMKNLHKSFEDFDYVLKVKEWIISQLVINDKYLKESIKSSFVEDLLQLVQAKIYFLDFTDNTQALLQITAFILGMKEFFSNYNPSPISRLLCELISSSNSTFSDSLFKCLGEVIKIVHQESHTVIRDFLDSLHSPDQIFKLIQILSSIVRSSKNSSELVWPLCRSGWLCCLKNKIVQDLPSFQSSQQIWLWKEILIIVKNILFRNELCSNKAGQFDFWAVAQVLKRQELRESCDKICEDTIDLAFEMLFDRELGKGSSKIRTPEVLPLVLTIILYSSESEKILKAREKFLILMLSHNSLPYLGKFSCLSIAIDYFSQENSSNYDIVEKIMSQVVPYNLLPQELSSIFSLISKVNDKKRLFLMQCFEQAVANCISESKYTLFLRPNKFFFFRNQKHLAVTLPDDQMPKKHEFSIFFWICFSKLKQKSCVADLQDKHLNRFKIKMDCNSIYIIYTDGKKKKFKAQGEVNILTKEWNFIGVSFFNQKVVKYFRPKENFNLFLNNQLINCKISGSLPSSIGAFKTLTLGKSMRKPRVIDARITSFFISSVCLYSENFESIRSTFPLVISQFNVDSWSSFQDFPTVSKLITDSVVFSLFPFMDEVVDKSGNFIEKDCERFNGVGLFEAFSDVGGLKMLLALIDFTQYNENFALTVIKIVLHIIKCPESRPLIDQDFIRSLAYIMSQMPYTHNSIGNTFQIAASLDNPNWQHEFIRLTQLTDLGLVINPGDKYDFLTIFIKLLKQNFNCDKFCILLMFCFIKDLELTPEEFSSTLFSVIPAEINEEVMKAVNLLVFVSTYYLKSQILAGLLKGLVLNQVKLEKSSPLELTLMNALQVLPHWKGRIDLVQFLLMRSFRNLERFGLNDSEEVCTGIDNALEDNYDSEIIIGIIETLANFKGKLIKGSRQFMADLVLKKIGTKIDNLEGILNKLLDYSNKIAQKVYNSERFMGTFCYLFKNKPELNALLKNLTNSFIVLQKKVKNFHRFRIFLKKLKKSGVNTLELYQMVFISIKSSINSPFLFLDFSQILEECIPESLSQHKSTYKTIIKDLIIFAKSLKLLQLSEPCLQSLSTTDIRSRLKTAEKRQLLKEDIYLKEGGFYRMILKYILIGISIENTPEYFEMLPELLLTTESAQLPGKYKQYSEFSSKSVSKDFYDIYIFTELLYIYYYTDDPESLFVDFLLIFIVDFCIYDKLFSLVSSLKKEDVNSYKLIVTENLSQVFPSCRSHLNPAARQELLKVFPDLDLTSSFLLNADESTSFKIFIGKMLEKMVCFKQFKENSESLLRLLKSKEWVADIHFFLTVHTSVRVNLAGDSSSCFKPALVEKIELSSAYRYDSEIWMVLQQTLIDWVKVVFEEQNRLKNFIRYKYQKFVKVKRECDEFDLASSSILSSNDGFMKLRNSMDLERRNLFLRKCLRARDSKERFVSPSKPDRVAEGYFESLYDVSQVEYELDDITEYSENNFAGGLARECEMIKIKGSFYGKLEIDCNFLAFYSDGSIKPKTESYVGSAPDFTKESKVFNYVWHVSEISEVFARRYIHRPTGLEVFLKSGKSYYFNLFSSHQCKDLLQQMEVWKTNGVSVFSSISEKDLQAFTQAWKKGTFSNFEYLTLLNKFGNRSYNDLSQYPVFPWVLNKFDSESIDLKDETNFRDFSMPIGAISEVPRDSARKRFDMISPEDEMIPFHHGTHYSTGASVSYYMVRLEPFTSQAKKIQNDTFDMPDRLFHCVQRSWESCLSNNSDVKELIPEFFYLPEMFININKYSLGFTQAGNDANVVMLPKWSNGSALCFIKTHRQALESSYVSKNLHLWIDLIFGYKQQGKAAVDSINVFGPAAYLSSFEKLARTAANVQGVIDEAFFFGQVPTQLFKKPHAGREVAEAGRLDSFGKNWTEQGRPFEFSLIQSERPCKVLAVFIVARTVLAVKLERSKVLISKIKNNKVVEEVSLEKVSFVNSETWPGSKYWTSISASPDLIRLGPSHFAVYQERLLVSGLHQDNSIKLHSFEGLLLKSLIIHSGIVVSVAVSSKYVLSAGLGNSLNAWSQGEFKVFIGHQAPVSVIVVQEVLQMVFSLSVEGKIIVHDLRSAECLRRIWDCGVISCFAVSPLGFLAFCVKDLRKVMVSTLNGFEVNCLQGVNEVVNCMKFDLFGDVLVCGTSESIIVKDVFESKMIKKKVEGAVWAIDIVKDPDFIVFVINLNLVAKIYMTNWE